MYVIYTYIRFYRPISLRNYKSKCPLTPENISFRFKFISGIRARLFVVSGCKTN